MLVNLDHLQNTQFWPRELIICYVDRTMQLTIFLSQVPKCWEQGVHHHA